MDYKTKNMLKKENLLHVCNSLAMAFMSSFLGDKPKYKIIQEGNESYLILDNKQYYSNLERLDYHLVPKDVFLFIF